MADSMDAVETVHEKLAQVLKERNELAMEVTRLQMSIGPLANLADEVIEQKGLEWLKHYSGLPIHLLYREQGKYTMPTLEDCLRAKVVAEGGEWEY